MPKYSIVIPLHNEQENVTDLYDRLKAVMENAGESFEIVFVDDGSGDDTFHLLRQIADSVTAFFDQLEKSGNAKRVLFMTFSEFGRRVHENGSRGTDHGSGSCLFLAGPGAKGGPIGKHPSLSDLDDGDLRFHTDFRQVYATVLDGWGKPYPEI